MTLKTETESLRAAIGMFHTEQALAENNENVNRNMVASNDFQDHSSWQGAGSWVARSYNAVGEELTFIRENGWHTNTFYYGPYQTTLRHKGFDSTYPEEVSHRMYGKSLDTCVGLSYTQNEDGDIHQFHMNVSDRKGYSMEVDNKGVRVTIYPDHPNYAEYDYPEEEVEPSPEGESLIMGKLVYIKL
jgi:hypothetical protein